MAVRDSEALFLEVLEATPASGLPIEFEAYDGANPATMLALFDKASKGSFQSLLSEVGGGQFTLQRSDPKATVDALAEGNIIRCKLGGIERFAYFIEEPEETLTSRAEAGGEVHVIAGRGVLSYLERAAVYPPIWPPQAASFVGATESRVTSTVHNVPRPSGTKGGDVAIVTILSLGNAPAVPKGWRKIHEAEQGTLTLRIYRRRLTSREPSSWKFTWTHSTTSIAGAVVLRNATSDETTYSIADKSNSSGTAITSPSLNVGVVDGYLLSIAATSANTAIAPPGGLTERMDKGGTGGTLEIATLANPDLGDTADLVSTAGISGNWIGVQLFVPSTLTNDWVFSDATFGQVLSTLIDAAQDRGTIPHLTYDFDGDVDSQGQPWPDTHELTFHAGTNLLDVWRHLVSLGLEGEMTPSLKLQAFVDRSRHFEQSVIFRKGKHLRADVTRKTHGSARRTRMLVEGAGGRIVEVPDPPAETNVLIGRREGALELTTSDDPTELQRAGDAALALTRLESDALTIPVQHGPAEEGHYEPWRDYRGGDWISLDAEGTGELDTERIVGLTLEQNGTDYTVELALNALAFSIEARLKRLIDAISGRSGSSGGASASLGLGGAGGSGTAGTGSGLVAVQTGDTAGYLNDKLVAGTGITKTVTGSAGARKVQLSAPSAVHPDLAAHDALGLATQAELDAHAATPHGSTVFINVKDHGAVGDATTDDTAAFLAAIAAMPPGSKLYVPPPTGAYYKVTATLSITQRGCSIEGAGSEYGTRIHMATANTTLLSVVPSALDGTRNQTNEIRNILLTGPGGATSGRGVYASSDVHLVNVGIAGFYEGLYWDTATFYSRAYGLFITNCVRGVVMSGTNNCTLDTCRITGNFGGGGLIGPVTDGVVMDTGLVRGLTNRIVNCSIEYFSGDGIRWNGGAGGEILGCYFESQQSSSGHAHVRLGESHATQALLIAGNYFQGDGIAGFDAIAAVNTSEITVANNRFGINGGIGISASGAGNANWILFNNKNAPAGTFALPASSYTLDPASPPATVGTPGLTFGTSNSAGSASTAVRTDATLAIFDATAPSTQAIGDSAATGSAAFAARRDHKHAMPAFGSPVAVGGANSDGVATTVARSDHVHAGSSGGGQILVSDTPAGSPLVFSDLIQNEAGTDLVYADS